MSEQTIYPTERNPGNISSQEPRDILAGAKDLVNDLAAGANQKVGAARDSIEDSYRAAKETVADVQAAVVGKGDVAVKATGRYVK